MSIQRFLAPRLTGPRFEGHAIPLEFLKDLAELEEIVIEVAKAQYLSEHKDRKRSPRGFTQGVEFKLTAVEDGSARPVIDLVIAATALIPPQCQLYFESARDAIVNGIAAAEQKQPVNQYLSDKTLSYFDRIGRNLRDGEAIEFDRGASTPPARLTKETRRRLLLASTAVTELTEEIQVRGTVPEADQDDMTFELQLFDGRKIKAPISTQHLETVIEAFTGYKAGTRVLVQGVGRFNRNELLKGFDSIEYVNILDPLDISARIDELRMLKEGWLEGTGDPMLPPGLDWLANAFTQNFPEELPLPYLYPTPEGNVRAEWTLDRNDITLDIDLVSMLGRWHALQLDEDHEQERELNLGDADDWKWLVQQLQPGGAA